MAEVEMKETPFPSMTPNGVPPATPQMSAPAPDADAWSLDSLRLSQDFPELVDGQKVLTAVPIRRPARQEFFRVHERPEWRFETCIFQDEIDRGEAYLVHPGLRSALANDLKPVVLFTCVSRQGTTFLWPARLPGQDRRASSWHTSALEAAQIAMTSWIRLVANQQAGAYEVYRAAAYTAEPEWPDITFEALM